MEEDNSTSECAICLQPILYPVKLPCNHSFCFLCIKGVRRDPSSIKRCAMCRTDFSLEQIEQSLELDKEHLTKKKFKWLYESRGGNSWWAFDERTSEEIEESFLSSKDQIAINIAGYTYIIDFQKMQQFNAQHPTRIRKIKRQEHDEHDGSSEGDCSYRIKGIAGLRIATHESQLTTSADNLSQTLSDALQIEDEKN